MKLLNSLKKYKQLKKLLALSAILAAAHCHAGLLSNLLQPNSQTNKVTLTGLVEQAANTNNSSTLLNNEIATLKTNQFSQGLTTNQFSQLLASLQTNGTNSPSTNNWSVLAEKLNAMFGNKFNLSNTNQWMQLVNSALTNKTQFVSTNQLAQLLNSKITSTTTNQPTSTAITEAVDWFKSKK